MADRLAVRTPLRQLVRGLSQLGRHGKLLQDRTLHPEVALRGALAVGHQPPPGLGAVEVGSEIVELRRVVRHDVVDRVLRNERPLSIEPEARRYRDVLAQELRAKDIWKWRRVVERVPRFPSSASAGGEPAPPRRVREIVAQSAQTRDRQKGPVLVIGDEDGMLGPDVLLAKDELPTRDGRVGAGSSPDFVDTVVPQTAIVSYWTGDRYPNDE